MNPPQPRSTAQTRPRSDPNSYPPPALRMRPPPTASFTPAHAHPAPLSLPQRACAAWPRCECASSPSLHSHRSTSPAGPFAPALHARLVCSQGAESPRSVGAQGRVRSSLPRPLLLLPPTVAARGSVCACVCVRARWGGGGGREGAAMPRGRPPSASGDSGTAGARAGKWRGWVERGAAGSGEERGSLRGLRI